MSIERKKILIVDDSDIDREMLRNILEKEYEVYEESNGYAALGKFIEQKIDLDAVMLDIAMPIFDGFAVLEILRGNNVKNIPIIMITSEATKENVCKALQYGVKEFIKKPFDPETTLSRLRVVFDMPEVKTPKESTQYDDWDESGHEVLSKRDFDKTNQYINKLKNLFSEFIRNRSADDMDSLNIDHYSRVGDIMFLLSKQYAADNPKLKLTTEHVKIIAAAAYLHDIGMMTLPDECLYGEKCTDNMLLSIYYDHTTVGSKLVRFNPARTCKFFVDTCSEICQNHHEHWDGSGFPHQKKGLGVGTIFPSLCAVASDFDKKFIKRKEYDIVQFDFIFKEITHINGIYNPEAIKLFEKCKNNIILYYKQNGKGFNW